MSDIEELIKTANQLSERLEKAANDEKKFCFDLQHRFEQMSWEIMKTANELKELKYYYA